MIPIILAFKPYLVQLMGKTPRFLVGTMDVCLMPHETIKIFKFAFTLNIIEKKCPHTTVIYDIYICIIIFTMDPLHTCEFEILL